MNLSIILLCLTEVLLTVSRVIQSSDGTNIFANAVGNSRNPSLVFVHGFALSGLVFDDLLEDRRLLDRFYLVTYDLRGHGRSDKPTTAEGYASQLFADDFAAVSTTFNLKSPIFVGWSYGGSVASDISTYLPAGSISGIVAAAALLYTGLTGVNTPQSLAYVPGFFVNDDVAVDINTKLAFVDSCFNDPANVPAEIKWSWLGATTLQLPPVSSLLIARTQDATELYDAGSKGLPLLMISGTNDQVLLNDVIINDIAPHFSNITVQKVQGGSHALFYDNKEEFIRALVGFASKIFKK